MKRTDEQNICVCTNTPIHACAVHIQRYAKNVILRTLEVQACSRPYCISVY